MQITIADTIDFIRKYDKKNRFSHWSKNEICFAILEAIHNNCFLWHGTGELNGVAIGNRINDRTILVSMVVAKPGYMKPLLKAFIERFKGINLVADRRDKMVDFSNIIKRYA